MSSVNSDPNDSVSDVFVNATKTEKGGIKIDFNVVLDLKKPEKKSGNERSVFRSLISDTESTKKQSDKEDKEDKKDKMKDSIEDVIKEHHKKRKRQSKILFGRLSSEDLARFL